jgi:hypothetical protein
MNYNLEEIALIAEVLGGLGILITLIYLAIQFRENTKATRSATASSTNATLVSWYNGIGKNEQASR